MKDHTHRSEQLAQKDEFTKRVLTFFEFLAGGLSGQIAKDLTGGAYLPPDLKELFNPQNFRCAGVGGIVGTAGFVGVVVFIAAGHEYIKYKRRQNENWDDDPYEPKKLAGFAAMHWQDILKTAAKLYLVGALVFFFFNLLASAPHLIGSLYTSPTNILLETSFDLLMIILATTAFVIGLGLLGVKSNKADAVLFGFGGFMAGAAATTSIMHRNPSAFWAPYLIPGLVGGLASQIPSIPIGLHMLGKHLVEKYLYSSENNQLSERSSLLGHQPQL